MFPKENDWNRRTPVKKLILKNLSKLKVETRNNENSKQTRHYDTTTITAIHQSEIWNWWINPSKFDNFNLTSFFNINFL